jgi:hypothetical protein
MRRLKLASIGAAVIVILFSGWYLLDRFSNSRKLPYFTVASGRDSTLTIGIIGDSWVAEEKLDSILHYGLLESKITNSIISSGHPGAKSKIIYQNLFGLNDKSHSSKFILEKRPEYCIVIAGVNDAAGQVGSEYYSYHVSQIVETLLHYKIKPVLVSLPEFGIEETTEKMDIVSKTRNEISAYFNNDGVIDNIRIYRNALNKALQTSHLNDSVLVVDFDNICPEYSRNKELYMNPAHLSKSGNLRLGNLIIDKLKNDLSHYANGPSRQIEAKNDSDPKAKLNITD